MIAHALVDPFVVAAENDDILLERQLVGGFLVETPAVRGCEDDLVVVPLGSQMGDQTVDRLNLQNHAGAKAEGIIINLTMFVECPVTQIMHIYLAEPFVLCALYNRVVER